VHCVDLYYRGRKKRICFQTEKEKKLAGGIGETLGAESRGGDKTDFFTFEDGLSPNHSEKYSKKTGEEKVFHQGRRREGLVGGSEKK